MASTTPTPPLSHIDKQRRCSSFLHTSRRRTVQESSVQTRTLSGSHHAAAFTKNMPKTRNAPAACMLVLAALAATPQGLVGGTSPSNLVSFMAPPVGTTEHLSTTAFAVSLLNSSTVWFPH